MADFSSSSSSSSGSGFNSSRSGSTLIASLCLMPATLSAKSRSATDSIASILLSSSVRSSSAPSVCSGSATSPPASSVCSSSSFVLIAIFSKLFSASSSFIVLPIFLLSDCCTAGISVSPASRSISPVIAASVPSDCCPSFF